MTNMGIDLLATDSWHGRSCVVVGSGPSLRSFDFHRLNGVLSIGVNRAFEFFSPTILLALDARFYERVLNGTYGPEALAKFNAYEGIKVGIRICQQHVAGVREIRSLGAGGPIVPVEQGLYHGNNSGYCAVALALALGANPVYVMGIDLRYDGPAEAQITHNHKGHPEKTPEKDLISKCLPHFVCLSRMIEGRRVKVFNPDWPQKPFSRLADFFEVVPPSLNIGGEPCL